MKKHTAQHPFPFHFFCSVALCIFILHSLNWCQSQPVSICVFVCCLTVCVSVSLLGPCCWRTSQAVPNKRAQGGLLWQQLVWCAALSVFVCVLSPGHAGQTGPVHMEPAPLVSFVVALGVFPIGAWSIQYHATSSHSSSSSSRRRKAVFPSPFLSVSFVFLDSHSFQFPNTKCSSLSPSLTLHILPCLPNLLFSELFFSSTVSLA